MNHANDVITLVAAATAVASSPTPTSTTPADSFSYGSTSGENGPESSSIPLYIKIAIGVFLSVVIFVSIFGNLLVCVAIASDRRLRRLGNLFLVSLAIADLCVGALVMTFALANDLMEYWAFGPQLCEIWIAFDISCSTCSIINLCAIALDRFAHIKDPMLYNRWMNKRIILVSVSMIWLVSCSISFLPISLGWHKPTPPESSFILTTTSFPDFGVAIPSPTSTTVTIDQRKNASQSDDFDGFLYDYGDDEDDDAKVIRHRIQRSAMARLSSHNILFSPLFRNHTIGAVNVSQSYFLPPPISPDVAPDDRAEEALVLGEDDDVLQMAFSSLSQTSSITVDDDDDRHGGADIGVSPAPEIEPTGSLPQCALDLTPTYAVVSSCISFYFPCLIMLCLYARLYSICQQHVKTIKSMTKTYPGMAAQCPPLECGGPNKNQLVVGANNNGNRPSLNSPSVVNHQQQNQSHVSEHKAAITLGIIMGTFLACWMPFFCMNIVAAFCKTCIPASVFKILTWLGYFNSCLNPAIYSIFNTEFRDAFRRILVRYVFNSDVSRACNQICKPCTGNKPNESGGGGGTANTTANNSTNTPKPAAIRPSLESNREELKIVIVSTNESAMAPTGSNLPPPNGLGPAEEPSPPPPPPKKQPIRNKCSSSSKQQQQPKTTRPQIHLYSSHSFDHNRSTSAKFVTQSHQVSSSNPNLERNNSANAHANVAAITRNESFHL